MAGVIDADKPQRNLVPSPVNSREAVRKWRGRRGSEPATSDVTGRRSNQLNYVPALCYVLNVTRTFRSTKKT